MLNIIKQKNKNLVNCVDDKTKLVSVLNLKHSNFLDNVKHFPAATKEWCNSIYAYNKSAVKLLPVYDITVIKLIKSYFNFYKTNKKNVISRRLRKKSIRCSTNRVFVSKAELKHTNNKVIITLFIYNQQEKYILSKLEKIDCNIFGFNNKRLLTIIKLIKLQAISIISQIKKEKNLLDCKQKNLINKYKHYETLFYKSFITKSISKDNLKKFYLKKLGFNKRKFEYSFLVPFNILLNKIYNKKVEFNLVKLKYFYLNSDIFSQAIAIKIKKNKKLLKIFKTSLNLVKLPFLNKFKSKVVSDKLYITSFTGKLKYFDAINFYSENKTGVDVLQQILQVFNNKKKYTFNYIESAVLSSIKLKAVNGVRFEASGRLSRRFTASRSLFKFKYKGSLKNINSSYRGLPSVLLRGHVRPNIQYTNITSKTLNGSFGLKGWISSD